MATNTVVTPTCSANLYRGYFQTALAKVVVGQEPDAQTFHAHEGILSKSPFFERALNGGFKESITREVKLPEDDPDIFSAVLEYLYGEEYSPRFTTRKETRTLYRETYPQPTVEDPFGPLDPPPRGVKGSVVAIEWKILSSYGTTGEAALRHAKIYCLAEKLGLGDLQTLVLAKLRLCGPISGISFIRSAAYLVENSSDTDGVLSAFLGSYVQGIPEPALLLEDY